MDPLLPKLLYQRPRIGGIDSAHEPGQPQGVQFCIKEPTRAVQPAGGQPHPPLGTPAAPHEERAGQLPSAHHLGYTVQARGAVMRPISGTKRTATLLSPRPSEGAPHCPARSVRGPKFLQKNNFFHKPSHLRTHSVPSSIYLVITFSRHAPVASCVKRHQKCPCVCCPLPSSPLSTYVLTCSEEPAFPRTVCLFILSKFWFLVQLIHPTVFFLVINECSCLY